MTIFLINIRKGFSMDNQKHRKFVEEMMVTFGGKAPEENNAPELGTEGPPEPEYNAVDVFTNAANDMLKDFMPVSTADTAGAPTHVMVTDTMTNDEPADQTPEITDVTDASIDPSADQIVFDMVDGTLCIKFADTELHLGPDAVSKLKDYLDKLEDSSDESADELDSEDEAEDDDPDSSDNTDDSSDSDEEDEEKVEEGWAHEDILPKGTTKCPKGHKLVISHGNAHCPTCHRDWTIKVI